MGKEVHLHVCCSIINFNSKLFQSLNDPEVPKTKVKRELFATGRNFCITVHSTVIPSSCVLQELIKESLNYTLEHTKLLRRSIWLKLS